MFDEKLILLKDLKDVKDIIIMGKFWCGSQNDIMIYAQVEDQEVERKRIFARNNHTRRVSINGAVKKIIPEVKEPSPVVMGSSDGFMIAGNGFHVIQSMYASRVLNRARGDYRVGSMDVIKNMFQDNTYYKDEFGNLLIANEAIPNNISTPRIIGLLYSSPSVGAPESNAAFGIISEDSKSKFTKTYIEVPLIEDKAKVLVTYHGSAKPSDIMEVELRHGFSGSESPLEYQENLTDKVLKILGPQAIGVASIGGAHHNTYIGKIRK